MWVGVNRHVCSIVRIHWGEGVNVHASTLVCVHVGACLQWCACECATFAMVCARTCACECACSMVCVHVNVHTCEGVQVCRRGGRGSQPRPRAVRCGAVRRGSPAPRARGKGKGLPCARGARPCPARGRAEPGRAGQRLTWRSTPSRPWWCAPPSRAAAPPRCPCPPAPRTSAPPCAPPAPNRQRPRPARRGPAPSARSPVHAGTWSPLRAPPRLAQRVPHVCLRLNPL